MGLLAGEREKRIVDAGQGSREVLAGETSSGSPQEGTLSVLDGGADSVCGETAAGAEDVGRRRQVAGLTFLVPATLMSEHGMPWLHGEAGTGTNVQYREAGTGTNVQHREAGTGTNVQHREAALRSSRLWTPVSPPGHLSASPSSCLCPPRSQHFPCPLSPTLSVRLSVCGYLSTPLALPGHVCVGASPPGLGVGPTLS